MAAKLPDDLLRALAPALDSGALLTSHADRVAYGYDNSRRSALPDAVALPVRTEQVQAIVRACRQHRVPVVARGRGTNTTGASVPIAGGVVVSFERMNRILAIEPDDRLAVVEPGVTNGELQRAARAHGFFWPPDPTVAPFFIPSLRIAPRRWELPAMSGSCRQPSIDQRAPVGVSSTRTPMASRPSRIASAAA